MPRFNSRGDVTRGYQLSWFDDNRTIYQDCSTGVCKVVLSDATVIAERASAFTYGISGKWAASGATPSGEPIVYGYFGDLPGAGIGPDCDPIGPDGSFVYKRQYYSYGPWGFLGGSDFGGDCSAVQNHGGGKVTWVENRQLKGTMPVPDIKCYKYRYKDGHILYQDLSGRLIFDTKILLPSGIYFRPDFMLSAAGDLMAAYAPDEGEGNPIVFGYTAAQLAALPDLNAPAPSPTPSASVSIKAFERKMWMAPFFSHSERYGDTPMADHNGNAIICVENETDPGTLQRELQKYSQLGMPLIVDGGKKQYPEFENLTIAYWAGNAASAQHALTLIEKPVIWYEDTNSALGWPAQKPSWMTGNVWPAVQIYRQPGEALSVFRNRAIELCNKVNSYGQPFFMVPRFDDFNGSGSIDQTLEAMPIYVELINNYQIIGFLPFSDRRGNSISKNKSLWDWARAFLYAMPARPNRFDYWQPRNMSMDDVLKNKFGQSTSLITLSKKEKDYILTALEKD